MSSDHIEPGEGHSPAAWVAVTVMLIGIAVSTLALFIGQLWLIIAGVVVVVVGALLGFILSKAGYGVRGPKYTPKGHQ